MKKIKEIYEGLTKKQKKILTTVIVAFLLFIIFIIAFNKGVENGIIDVSILPLLFTLLFFFIVPFIAVIVLTVIFGKMYFQKKNLLTLYEKTFGMINDEEYDLSVYQNYLDEDNLNI